MSVIRVILDLLFPPKCTFCRKVLRHGESGICKKCEESLPYASVDVEVQFAERCIATLYYEGDVREAILRFKFNGITAYAGVFGKLLAKSIEERLAGQYDLISWVPLSGPRLKERGYDQSMLLAMATALELDDVAVETLKKPVSVAPQSLTGDAAARRANIAGAFEAADKELIEGRRILLIDDIVTTGSTLAECARVLGAAGAESVVCAAVARSRD